MDQLQQFIGRGRLITYGLLVLSNITLLGASYVLLHYFEIAPALVISAGLLVALLLPLAVLWYISNLFTQPLRLVRQAIMYLAPESSGIAPPKPEDLQLGRTLTVNLINRIYQFAGAAQASASTPANSATGLSANFIANNLPLPLAVLNANDQLIYANPAFLEYTHQADADISGKHIHDVLNISFSSNDTLEQWLATSKADKATSAYNWERVRLGDPTEASARLFDLTAYYNKDNPQGYETLLLLSDHTDRYSQDDQAVNYVALAVHELRTPLTLLRGYIEALEEELDGSLNDELKGFMENMQTAAQQLAAFVNNILNVARVEDGQMLLHLSEERWQDVLKTTLDDLTLRAKIRGITIRSEIDENLPTVAIDRISTYEIMSNLIDNAIKYSGTSKEIVVRAHVTSDGMVETTVQDFGVGIPRSAIPHLFEKFYRDHHNRAQVGGTGLGLFLCKTLVTGHGGTLYVQSKEGEGSTFGFTLQQYKQVADQLKNSDNSDIVRSAHGWIKNHSLYRD